MEKPSKLPPKATTHYYTIEGMQKLAEEMLNDPDLGCGSRMVSAFSGDGGKLGVKPPAADAAAADQMRYDFGYIIMSI